MSINLEKNQKQIDVLKIMLDETIQKDINILDRSIMQMILDSRNENDESLRMLEKSLFNSESPIEQLNVEDSLVLKLVYQRKQ